MDLEEYKRMGNFTLSSGLKSKVFYDLKEAMGDPQVLDEMIVNLLSRVTLLPDLFIGMDYGGIPLATGLSLKTDIPFAVIRKKRNDHSMKKRIEGYQEKGNVILVDDVKMTGKSLDEAESWLNENGYKITQTLTILERDINGEII